MWKSFSKDLTKKKNCYNYKKAVKNRVRKGLFLEVFNSTQHVDSFF